MMRKMMRKRRKEYRCGVKKKRKLKLKGGGGGEWRNLFSIFKSKL